MFFTATTHTLQLRTGIAGNVDVVVAFIDHTTPGGTPGSQLTNITTATTTTVMSAPGSSTQRQVTFLSAHNRASALQTVSLVFDSNGTDYDLLSDVLLRPDETLYWDGKKFSVVDNAGNSRSVLIRPSSSDAVFPAIHTLLSTGTKTITSGSTFAVYLMRCPRTISGMTLLYRVTTAAVTITWAEVALATGSIVIGGNPSLTAKGYADVSAQVNSTGIKTTQVTATIYEGEDVWALAGNSASTAMVLRSGAADDLQIGNLASKAERPSTVIGSASTYTVEASGSAGASILGFF